MTRPRIDGLHIKSETYVPAARDIKDLTQGQDESYEDWQARLHETSRERRATFPNGQSVAKEAVSLSGIQDPSGIFRIPTLEQ